MNKLREDILFALRLHAQERLAGTSEVMKFMTLITRVHRESSFEARRFLDYENESSTSDD